ncbi:MAG: hypothetical protein K6U08_03190 [Firmicutes bacterium]|nr:hypothetical protein [Bacillota bacterium]
MVGEGELLRKDGLTIVRVRGDSYEMGFQHGALLKEEIAAMSAYCKELFLDGGPAEAARQLATALESNLPERYRQELKGLAAGSGLPYEDVVILNLFYELLGSRQPPGCSQFVVIPGSKGPSLVHGRNVDLGLGPEALELLQSHSVVLAVEPAGRRPFVSVALAGFVGVFTGMNDEGLTVALNAVPGVAVDPTGVPAGFLCRDALETCRTVEEVSASFTGSHWAAGGIVVVSDPAGAVALELDGGAVRARVPQQNGVLVATNHFLGAADASGESVVRYRRLSDALVRSRAPLSWEMAARQLHTVAVAPGRASPAGTLQSVVLLPDEAEVYASLSGLPATTGVFSRLAVEDLTEPCPLGEGVSEIRLPAGLDPVSKRRLYFRGEWLELTLRDLVALLGPTVSDPRLAPDWFLRPGYTATFFTLNLLGLDWDAEDTWQQCAAGAGNVIADAEGKHLGTYIGPLVTVLDTSTTEVKLETADRRAYRLTLTRAWPQGPWLVTAVEEVPYAGPP